MLCAIWLRTRQGTFDYFPSVNNYQSLISLIDAASLQQRKDHLAVLLLLSSDEELRRVIAKLDYWATGSVEEGNRKRTLDVVQIMFEKGRDLNKNQSVIEENIQYGVLFGNFHVFHPPLLVLNKELKLSLRKVTSQISPPASKIAYIQTGGKQKIIPIHEEDGVSVSSCSVTYFSSKINLERFMMSTTQGGMSLAVMIQGQEQVSKSKKSLSDVFVVEDDPMVLEIVARERREAEKLAARAKVTVDGRRRKPMEKMAKFNADIYSQGAGESCQQIPKLKKFSTKKNKNNAAKKDSNQGSVYSPTIDELLKLPDRIEGGKTMEEVLDDMDVEIVKRGRKHEEEMSKVDSEIEAEKMRQEQKDKRFIQNGLLKKRLRDEVTETELRRMFKENLDFLLNIQSGNGDSSRHEAYHKSGRTRQALYYTMITSPYSDDQLDWTLEEMSAVWMRDNKEQMDNNEYVWKVLLPEFFIKLYMDKFDISKIEAEKRIGESPLDPEDDEISDEDLDENEGEESFDTEMYS